MNQLTLAKQYSERIKDTHKRALYLENISKLYQITHEFHLLNRGLCARVILPGGYADFWLTTERWLHKGEVRKFGFLDWLEDRLGSERTYREEVILASDGAKQWQELKVETYTRLGSEWRALSVEERKGKK